MRSLSIKIYSPTR